ncbi:MAG: hypothetical protein J5710_11335 [Treponema sp.]|nr:hypothetical protein [Treponema sp.]
MTKEQLYQELYARYGFVTRARRCFLYTHKNQRLTDMFLENGKAILGWDSGNAGTFFKNMMNKGLTGSFICEDKPRIDKAVSKLVGKECCTFFYNTKSDAVKAAVGVGAKNIVSYRPWNKEQEDLSKADAVIIVPPFPWGEEIFILAMPSRTAMVGELVEPPFSLQTALTRSIYNLIAELGLRQEKDWFIYDTILTKYWERKGPYLYPKISENKYEEFVKHCLDCEIVINPSYNEPSIVPFGADKGVFTKLKNNPFEG